MNESVPTPALGIGERLRAARERLEFSVSQAAERLHCDPSSIEALEKEDFASMGAAVYARGHLRRYAELLGEPPGELLLAMNQKVADARALPDLTSIPQPERPADPRKYLKPLIVVGVAALFAVVVWWVLKGRHMTRASTTIATPTVLQPALLSAPLAATAPDAATTPAATPLIAIPDATVSPSATASPSTTASPSAAAVGQGSISTPYIALQLYALRDCWLDVRDAKGEKQIYGFLRVGKTATTHGQYPMRLIIGNVSAVRISRGNDPVKIPSKLNRLNTAVVSINADGSVEAAAAIPDSAKPKPKSHR